MKAKNFNGNGVDQSINGFNCLLEQRSTQYLWGANKTMGRNGKKLNLHKIKHCEDKALEFLKQRIPTDGNENLYNKMIEEAAQKAQEMLVESK